MTRRFFILFFHELRLLLVSPSTYAAGAVFLTIMGGVHWMALWQGSRTEQDWLPSENLFRLYWVPALFFVPMVTMRSFAEERRLGTLGTLLTTPVGPQAVTLAKFVSAYFLYLLLWCGAIAFPFVANGALIAASSDPRLLSAPALAGGMLFVAASSAAYVAVGLLCSSLTRSVMVAGLASFVAIFTLVIAHAGLTWLAETYDALRWLAEPAELMNSAKYAEDFARGVVDTRPFLHFGSVALLALGCTSLVIESKA